MRKLKLQIQRSFAIAAVLAVSVLLTDNTFAMGFGSGGANRKATPPVTASTATTTQPLPASTAVQTNAPITITAENCNAENLIKAGQKTCVDAAKNTVSYREDKSQCYVNMPDKCDMGVDLLEVKSGLMGSNTSYKCGKKDPKYAEVAAHCGVGPEDCKWETPACRAARVEAGLGACAVAVKEAKDAYTAFKNACNETNLGSSKQCLEEARVCFESRQEADESIDEEEAEEDSMFERLLGTIGLSEEKKKDIVANKCSVLNAKDYKTEKREQMRALRDAEKDMAKLKEDLAEKASEYSQKSAEMKKEFAEAQTKSQQTMSEAQKASADEGMQADAAILETKANQAAKRSQILQLMSKKAEAISARAAAAAQFDADLIKSNCELIAEGKTNEAYPIKGLTLGQRNYLMRSAARKLRYQKEFESCKQTSDAQKAANYRKLSLEITDVDVQIANLNREIVAEGTRANDIAVQKSAAQGRSTQLQQQMSAESLQQQQAIQTQMNEMQQQQLTRQMSSSEQTQAAQARITDAQKEIADLGKAPKGSKSPFEAAGKFDELAAKVRAIEETTCKEERKKLEDTLDKEGVLEAYNKGVWTGESEDDEDKDAGPSAENKGQK